jgi:hypothetical protein
LAHQRGKKENKQTNKKTLKKQNTTKQINPKFKYNTVSVSSSASSPTYVIVSSKDRKKTTKKSLETAL